MDIGEVAERFINAAEIERRMPRSGEKPMGYGSYRLQTVHTYADKAGWRKEKGDFLLAGDNPLAQERRSFTDGRSSKVTTEEVETWETCLRWTQDLLQNSQHRRALWAWAFAKAGGKPFSKWCSKTERIHPETGRRRKDRALEQIAAKLSDPEAVRECTADAHGAIGDVSGEPGSLPEGESGTADAHAWMADGAFTADFASLGDFSWSKRRNQIRRRRQEKKRAANG